MQIISSISAMHELRRALRRGSSMETLGLVPTMGALHEGHLSLVRAALEGCDRVAASIFVNPTQFAPGEDFAKYPRTFEADCALLEQAGVHYLFAPTTEEMYPPAAETFVDVPKIGSRLDGASRPGHFRGVTTVVSKLFHIVQPDRAYFGQKDAAQVAVLQAMVRDLNFDIELVVCPTRRDADGLALSSRNRYLSEAEREQALAIPQALCDAAESIGQGDSSSAIVRATLRHDLDAAGVRVDYTCVVDARSLEPVTEVRAGSLIAIAAFIGSTRLIDNFVVPIDEEVAE
nr:pantoate--beta-alanine ligase [Granulicella paludicola]